MKPIHQYLISAAAVVIIIAGMKYGAGIINQILLAYLFALCITPMPEWLIKKGMPKGLAILISIIVVLIVSFLVTALLASSIASLIDSIPEYEQRFREIYANFEEFAESQNLNIPDLVKKFSISPEKVVSISGKILGGLTKLLSSSFIIVMLLVFMIIELVGYYSDTRNGKREEVIHLQWLRGISKDLRKYVNITAFTGVITGVANFILLVILGVDFPFLWAFLSFLMSFVPNIGFLLSIIPPALIALLMLGGWQVLVVILGFWLINALVENVVRPIFMKEGLNISLLTTFLSLLVWGWILGMPGTVLGVPLTMVLIRLGRDLQQSDTSPPEEPSQP